MSGITESLAREFIMQLFRSDEMPEILTVDDRIEIFCQILPGSSEITKELLDELLGDYSIDHLKVIQVIK